MKKITLFASAFFIVAAGFCQHSGNLVLTKGQKYVVENKINAVSTQEVAGQSMESNATITTSNNFIVNTVKDGNYNITNTITKITTAMSAMGQNMNFDSDKKEDMDGEMGSNMKQMINQPKNVVVDKKGNIVSVVSDTAKKDSAAGMMSTMLGQFMGDPQKTGYGLTETFMVIPSNAKPGLSWTDSSLENGVKRSTIYTIKDIQAGEATIDISGTIDSDVKMQMQGMDISSKTNGKVTGQEIVDVKTGVIKQKTTNLETSGSMQTMGQDIPIKTKLTSLSTVKSI